MLLPLSVCGQCSYQHSFDPFKQKKSNISSQCKCFYCLDVLLKHSCVFVSAFEIIWHKSPNNFPASYVTLLIIGRPFLSREFSFTCPLVLLSAARLCVSADVQLLLTAEDPRPVIKWINCKQFPAFSPIICAAIFSCSLEHNYRASAIAFNFTRRLSKKGYDLTGYSIWLILHRCHKGWWIQVVLAVLCLSKWHLFWSGFSYCLHDKRTCSWSACVTPNPPHNNKVKDLLAIPIWSPDCAVKWF